MAFVPWLLMAAVFATRCAIKVFRSKAAIRATWLRKRWASGWRGAA